MNLPATIKNIQRAVGAEADGVFGPITAARVWAEIAARGEGYGAHEEPAGLGTALDARSAQTLATLDPKAQEFFTQFYRVANATAATYGCAYELIGGNRSWAEQDALYAQGRTLPGEIVTRATGGQSNHNFGIAGDFGVFRGAVYLDEADPKRAEQVHQACSIHAGACGLEWGGSWKSIVDVPHYEVATGLSLAQKRAVYAARGSVL